MNANHYDRALTNLVTSVSIILSIEMIVFAWKFQAQFAQPVLAALLLIHLTAISTSIFSAHQGTHLRLAAAVQLIALVLQGPGLMWANHQSLGAWLMVSTLLLAKQNPRGLANLVTWTIGVLIFWSGVQKLLHGMWLDGEFLHLMVAVGDARFVAFYEWIGLGDIAQQIQNTWQQQSDIHLKAPTRVILISNLVWLLEIILPIGLLVQRYQRLAAILLMLSLGAMQLVTREFTFALMCIAILSFIIQTRLFLRFRYTPLLFATLAFLLEYFIS